MDNFKKASSNSIINLSYLLFLIVWQPIKMLTIQIDGKGRITLMITLVVLFYNLFANPDVRKLMGSKPFVIWLVWIIYAFINMMIKGYHYTSNTPLFYFVNSLFIPYFALVLMCRECMIDFGKPLKLMVFAFSIYCILGFFFMGIVHNDNDSLMSLGNMLAINSSLLVFLLCVARNEKVISGFVFSTLIILVLLLIVVTATRKAFGVAVILMAFYGVSLAGLKPKNIFLVAILAIGVYVGVNYVMDNTYLGERLANTSEQAETRESLASDSKFLQFVGDRAPHYVLGWEVFKQYPVTGIGLYNFMHVTRFPERLHTDYMVQFAENGLIGVVLFILYYLWYIINLNKLRRVPERRSAAIIGIGWIVAVLFLGISAWTYDMPNVFICSGVVASFVYTYKKQ